MNTFTRPYNLHRQWVEDDMKEDYGYDNLIAFNEAVANGDLIIGADGYARPPVD